MLLLLVNFSGTACVRNPNKCIKEHKRQLNVNTASQHGRMTTALLYYDSESLDYNLPLTAFIMTWLCIKLQAADILFRSIRLRQAITLHISSAVVVKDQIRCRRPTRTQLGRCAFSVYWPADVWNKLPPIRLVDSRSFVRE